MKLKKLKEKHGKFFTIPNILSLVRIALIPLFMWLYIGLDYYIVTTVVVLLSCLTDVLDGIIARKFNQVSDYGKALDPAADKLTQMALMICLLSRFPYIGYLLIFIAFKELSSFALGLMMYKKTGVVKGAVWHGKVTTVLLFTMMLLHVVWIDITPVVSYTSVIICAVFMLYSFIWYAVRYIRITIKGYDFYEKK